MVTTCGMVTDIVRNVVGDRGEVVGLMGEGVDPHLYKPTRNDVKELLSADIVFYAGLLLEGRMSETFIKVARSGKPVYAVSEALDENYLREPPEFEGHFDPHVWMDVAAWSEAVSLVVDILCQFDPQGAEVYRANGEAYGAKLDELDSYVPQCHRHHSQGTTGVNHRTRRLRLLFAGLRHSCAFSTRHQHRVGSWRERH